MPERKHAFSFDVFLYCFCHWILDKMNWIEHERDRTIQRLKRTTLKEEKSMNNAITITRQMKFPGNPLRLQVVHFETPKDTAHATAPEPFQ